MTSERNFSTKPQWIVNRVFLTSTKILKRRNACKEKSQHSFRTTEKDGEESIWKE